MSAVASTDRSRTVVRCDGWGRPVAFSKWVFLRPRRAASLFISWAKASSEPAMASARATQASLPDCTIMPWSNSLTVTGVCGSMNILEPGTFQALGDTGMVWSRVSVLPLTAAKAR